MKNASALLSGDILRFESLYEGRLQAADATLRSVLIHVRKQKGKRLRPLLYLLVQAAVSPGSARDVGGAVLIEMLHTASLLHDDVVDGTDRRRGERSLNALMGNKVSVLAGDYLMASALAMAVPMSIPDVVPVLSRILMEMTSAELRQAETRRTAEISVDTYLGIVRGKTASLFEGACGLAASVQGEPGESVERFRRFGRSFGTGFQILDDVLDFTGDEAAMGKPRGQDLGNGNWTLPLILAHEGAGREERARLKVRLGRFNARDREWVMNFVVGRGGGLRAEERARAELRAASECLSGLAASDYRTALLSLCETGG